MNISGKSILVTGAASGIGKELTLLLAKKGAHLILIDKDLAGLETLNKGLDDKHKIIVANLADPAEVENAIETIHLESDSLDILINNAGIGVYKPITDLTDKEWDQSFQINVHAPFLLIKGLLPILQKSDSSLVINMGSKCGVNGIAERTAYCSTKFALRGLSLSLSEEYRAEDVRFMLVTLGSTMTGFGPLNINQKKTLKNDGKDYFSPDWVAETIISTIEKDDIQDELVLLPGGE
jgi:short-subunit dehydrogenase